MKIVVFCSLFLVPSPAVAIEYCNITRSPQDVHVELLEKDCTVVLVESITTVIHIDCSGVDFPPPTNYPHQSSLVERSPFRQRVWIGKNTGSSHPLSYVHMRWCVFPLLGDF